MLRTRTVKRETLAGIHHLGKVRRIVVEVDPVASTMRFRAKGCKTWWGPISLEHLCWYTLRKMSALEKANKAKNRKRKRRTP